MARRRFYEFGDYISLMYPELVNKDSDKKTLSRTVTFQVTDFCNLACKYCYQINKGSRSMPFETAKLFVDKLLSGEDGFREYINVDISPAIIIEFIGGEPLLEIDLIDKVTDYFRKRTIELNHPWSEKFAISICTNGVLYFDEKVQKYLEKNKDVVSLSITLDGTKELHDSCRVFPDGSPSFDLAYSASRDWRINKGRYLGSKITISPDNLSHVYKAMKFMVEEGYEDIMANTVYEEGWKLEHASEIYKQMKSFVNWYLDGHYSDNISFSYFDEMNGTPISVEENENWCGGTGYMLAMDPEGYLYPCLRYMESSVGCSCKPLRLGNVKTGICQDNDSKDVFKCLDCITRRSQSTDECFYCVIGKGCAWCSAYNYQETGSPNNRVIYSCDMHKARCLINCYYWNKVYELTGEDKHVDLWVPKQWAIPIIGEKEYDMLKELVLSRGGFVNNDLEMSKDICENQISRDEKFCC